SQLPLLFHPNWMHVYWSVPGILFQAALLVAGLLTLMFWLLDFRIRPERSSPWTWRERVLELLSLPLMAVLTLICVALPVLHAQTRLMLGRAIQFRVTPKL
ncbi:MAG: hypothetical protein HY866_15250, partial [Chloroflexi bacterium]|nr:hypothetical protein [Chloroflexota bacterium]